MEYFAGLDISMKETHICVVDRDGIACKRGCAHCCHIPTMLRPADPARLTKDIFRLSILDIVTLIEHFLAIYTGIDVSTADKVLQTAERAQGTLEPQPCPFLAPSLDCSIYAFRPVSCKIWFSPDAELSPKGRVVCGDFGAHADLHRKRQFERSYHLADNNGHMVDRGDALHSGPYLHFRVLPLYARLGRRADYPWTSSRS